MRPIRKTLTESERYLVPATKQEVRAEDMDEPGKEIIDLIKSLILENIADAAGADKSAPSVPPVIGVKFIVAGGNGVPSVFGGSLPGIAKPQKRLLPLELFESDDTYSIQTELPGSCTEFSVEYTDGKLKLTTGKSKEYTAEIPLEHEIDPAKTGSVVRNGVLEIVCVKRG